MQSARAAQQATDRGVEGLDAGQGPLQKRHQSEDQPPAFALLPMC